MIKEFCSLNLFYQHDVKYFRLSVIKPYCRLLGVSCGKNVTGLFIKWYGADFGVPGVAPLLTQSFSVVPFTISEQHGIPGNLRKLLGIPATRGLRLKTSGELVEVELDVGKVLVTQQDAGQSRTCILVLHSFWVQELWGILNFGKGAKTVKIRRTIDFYNSLEAVVVGCLIFNKQVPASRILRVAKASHLTAVFFQLFATLITLSTLRRPNNG